MPTATFESGGITPRRRAGTDGELARAVGRGDVDAFEALYERHHLALLSFSRHMLGRVHDAEDVVQHTFLAADTEFRQGRIPGSVRAWLYTVARNRCISVIRARRDERELPDLGVPSTENLAGEVERREQLRELLADLRTLPEDQRAALLLAELGDLSHAEVAHVIGVRTGKVKALVFRARETLMAAADARAIPCRSIQEELAVATGPARRRRHLRDHVARCEGCRAYAERVAAQRSSLAAILPVVPTIALREGVLAGLGAGTASAATGGASAGLGLLAAKTAAAKALAIAAIGGAAAGGGTVAITTLDPPRNERPPARSAAPASPALAPAAGAPTGTALAEPDRAPQRAGSRPASARPLARAGRRAERTRAEPAGARNAPKQPVTTAARKLEPAADGEQSGARPDAPRGLALGHAKQQARGKAPRGHDPGKPKREAARPRPKPQAAPKPAGPRAPKPARGKPAAPARPETPKPPRTEVEPADKPAPAKKAKPEPPAETPKPPRTEVEPADKPAPAKKAKPEPPVP